MSKHDVVVIGAGHNGLVTAGLLAQRGRRVVVLEKRERIGGLAATWEFHPGYQTTGIHTDTTLFRLSVFDALRLDQHGASRASQAPDLLALGDDGQGVLLAGDRTAASREIEKVSEEDAKAWVELHEYIDRVRPVLASFLEQTPIDLTDIESMGAWDLFKRGLRVRSLGKRDMMELLRVPPMCAADWLNERLQTDLLKGVLSVPAVRGTFMGPWSPGSNANLLLHLAAQSTGVRGGVPALNAALEKAVRAAGVEIHTGVEVTGLTPGAPHLLELNGGDTVEAVTVAAACDPKTLFLDLLPMAALSSSLERRMLNYRTKGTTAQVVLALDAPLALTAAGDRPVEHACTGSHLDDVERAFDALKYGRFSEKPVLEIHAPPDMAPDGHASVNILVHFAPYELDGGWTDASREALGAAVVTELQRHAPDVARHIVHQRVLAPPDIESHYGTTGGHIHHGEHGLDQLLVRPIPECIAGRTPYPGLFLCGSGIHPGGGLTGMPGRLAADTISAAV